MLGRKWQFIAVMTLAMVMLFASVPGALAATEGNYEYTGTGGSVRIDKYLATAPGGPVVIPAILGGKPVGSIGDDAFKSRADITSVIIPPGVGSIGNNAFNNCSGLTSVTIPDSVYYIGQSAFIWCESLTSVTIPFRVTDINSGTFAECTSLTSVILPAGVKSIGGSAFQNCKKLTNVVIPSSVKSIGDSAFLNCEALTRVNIPLGVTTIGDQSFAGCSKLTSVHVPASVTIIDEYAFSGCQALTSVTIPDSVKSIGKKAFSACSGLTSVTIGTGVTSIDVEAFQNCSKLHSAVFEGAAPSTIGVRAFDRVAAGFKLYLTPSTANWPTPPAQWNGYTTARRTFAAAPVEGSNRYATAVAASAKAFPAGSSHYAVIATAENWPDALGGAALAGVLDCPILLTQKGTLPAETRAEIIRLNAKHVIVLGGPGAVSDAVDAQIRGIAGVKVERIKGADRYDTANQVAARTIMEQGDNYDGFAFIATGMNFPDALGASPLAAAKHWPIYLSNPKQGDNAALIAMMKGKGVRSVLILGGKSVVAESIEHKAAELGGAYRLAGDNRYETAVRVATYGVSNKGMSWNKLAIATGMNFPDALAGGALQGRDNSVMLLTTPGTVLNASVGAKLADIKSAVYEVRFLGGKSVVTDPVRTSVTNIVKK